MKNANNLVKAVDFCTRLATLIHRPAGLQVEKEHAMSRIDTLGRIESLLKEFLEAGDREILDPARTAEDVMAQMPVTHSHIIDGHDEVSFRDLVRWAAHDVWEASCE